MTNTPHLMKVGAVWASIVYVICFVGVALFPQTRSLFMFYALHVDLDLGHNVTTLTTFVTGFIIWNIVIALAFGLFGFLSNRIPK